LSWAPLSAWASEPFRYPEGKCGKGSLKYINDLPVLMVEGTPEEMGEQVGVLGIKPATKLLSYPKEILKDVGAGATYPLLAATGKSMVPHFPPDQLKEFEAAAKASGVDRDLLVVGNTMFDIKKLIACSTLIVEPERSATGQILFGRNLDFPTCGFLQDYTLVRVSKPAGKHAFAAITFPGLMGCLSGINDAGLSVAVLEVYESADDSVKLDPTGIPYAMCFRWVLEECTTVAEAEKALKDMKRTTLVNLAVCDTKGGAVLEITPKQVVLRPADRGLCACTNHFRSKGLCTSTDCDRYAKLEKCQEMPKLDIGDIAKNLNAVNQGELTLQTMIFEPASLKLHLAFGKCPSSQLPLKTLDLKPLLKPEDK
jgi:hypothetical protein